MAGVIVQLQKDLDGAVDGLEDDPLSLITGDLATLENASAKLASQAAVSAWFGEGAIAAQLPYYWWKVLIPSVHYSRPTFWAAFARSGL